MITMQKNGIVFRMEFASFLMSSIASEHHPQESHEQEREIIIIDKSGGKEALIMDKCAHQAQASEEKKGSCMRSLL